jgi:dTMP kinase
MKIIVLEGLDKAGKSTQVKLLGTALANLGKAVVVSRFHRYDTPTGKLIKAWLDGEYDVDQKTIELIMAADKVAQQPWMQMLEDAGADFLILDRYTTSQHVYSRASGSPPSWVGSLVRDCREPDMEIYIDITPEESMKRKGGNDRYESNLLFLNEVRSFYWKRFMKQGENVVDGTYAVEDVHNEILKIVKGAYNL